MQTNSPLHCPGAIPACTAAVDRAARARHGGAVVLPARSAFMVSITTLWIPFTLVASAGQVARNAMQRSLTAKLGTWGATNIRFLFGFPFSLLFLSLVLLATGDPLPWPPSAFWPW